MKPFSKSDKYGLPVFIILTMAFLASVGNSSSIKDKQWDRFDAKGLQRKYEHFNQMVFINEHEGFLGGWSISDTSTQEANNIKNNDAIIYKTIDGGLTWVKGTFQKGSVESIEAESRAIYALKRIFTENSFNNLKSTIIKSGYGFSANK